MSTARVVQFYSAIHTTCSSSISMVRSSGKSAIVCRWGTILEDFDCLQPCLTLTIVDLPEVEDLTLNHASTGHPAVLHHAPIPVLLPILLPIRAAQKHACRIPPAQIPDKGVGLHYSRFSGPRGFNPLELRCTKLKLVILGVESAKSAKGARRSANPRGQCLCHAYHFGTTPQKRAGFNPALSELLAPS